MDDSPIEGSDVIWVLVPLSRSEYHRLIPTAGVLTPDGVPWQELRESIGLPSRPYRWNGRHYVLPLPRGEKSDD